MLEVSRLLFNEKEERKRNYFQVSLYSDFRNIGIFKEKAKYYSDGQVSGIDREVVNISNDATWVLEVDETYGNITFYNLYVLEETTEIKLQLEDEFNSILQKLFNKVKIGYQQEKRKQIALFYYQNSDDKLIPISKSLANKRVKEQIKSSLSLDEDCYIIARMDVYDVREPIKFGIGLSEELKIKNKEILDLYGFGLNALLWHLFQFYVNRNIEYLDYFYMREYIQKKYGEEEVKKGGIIEKFSNAIWNNCINLNISEMVEQYKVINKKYTHPSGQFKMNLNEN